MKKYLHIISLVLVGLFVAACGKTAEPAKESKSLEKAIDAVAFTYVKNQLATDNNKVVPGAQIAVMKDGKLVFNKAYGNIQSFENIDGEFTKLESPQKLTTDTLFDLASVSKIAATTQAMMKLFSEGKVSLEDKVIDYLPEYNNNGKENITIGQLLSHTSGLPQWKAIYLYSDNKEKTKEYIANQSLEFAPGEYKYSDLGFMTLGFVIEKVTGQTLDEYVENNIYKVIDLKSTMYNPVEKGHAKENIAVTSFGNPFELMMVDEENYPDFGYDMKADVEAFKKFTGWRNYHLQGEVNDGNAAMANSGVAGHAGLYSTASDLAKLFQLINDKGKFGKEVIYSEETVSKFLEDAHVTESGMSQLYGFWKTNGWLKQLSDDAIGHNGFTGTYVSISPKHNLVVVVLTNKMNTGQRENGYYSNINDLASTVNFVVNNEYIAE